MSRFISTLDYVRIAAPCPADWDNMLGNERVRFCGQCKLNVYNVSEMTKRDAEDLIAQAEGRLCIRYYRRLDGSIITRNCPVGLRAIKRRVSRVATAFGSALVSFMAGIGLHGIVNSYLFAPRHTMGQMAMNITVDTDRPTMGDVNEVRTYAVEPPITMGKVRIVKPKIKRR